MTRKIKQEKPMPNTVAAWYQRSAGSSVRLSLAPPVTGRMDLDAKRVNAGVPTYDER